MSDTTPEPERRAGRTGGLGDDGIVEREYLIAVQMELPADGSEIEAANALAGAIFRGEPRVFGVHIGGLSWSRN